MGVHRLWSWSKEKSQRDRLYESTDLVEFRGKRIIIDAASFLFFVIEDVMATRDMYYLGDYGPDFVAATRYFVQTFFLDYEIHTVWVQDGSFNPAKAATQQSRRAERAAPAADLCSRLFACLRNAPRAWSANEPFLTVAKEVSEGLRKVDTWLGDCTGIDDALYLLLDELAAASQRTGGPSLTQVRTILEADAYIAAQCLSQGFDAVMSSDTDFLVLDCPWIPLDFVQHRNGPDSCPCKLVPKGRFSEVMYASAMESLQPLLRMVKYQGGQATVVHSLEGFRLLLPDLACLLGNDFFFPTDPLSGQSKGFVKKVTVPLVGVQPSNGGGKVKQQAATTVTCDLSSNDKVQCARFLLVCLINGWVEGSSGALDLTGSCDSRATSKKSSSSSTSSPSPSPLAALLFPNAPRRMRGYLIARDQYNLESGMAHNQMPSILVEAGIAVQYAQCHSRFHKANLLCPSGEEDEEEGREEGLQREAEGSKQVERPRICTLSHLMPMQQFQFPMLNLSLQRRMFYELLFYRVHKEEALFEEELAGVDIIEEYVRLNANTGKVDLRQPFRSVRVALLCDGVKEGDEEAGGKDWRLVQATRVERYAQPGPSIHLRPLKLRLALFLDLLGYPSAADDEDGDAVDLVVQTVMGGKGTEESGLRDEVLAFVLSLRVLVVAYGEDAGLSLSDPEQRNYDAYRALLFAAATTLVQWGEETPAAPSVFEPTDRGVRPSYPSWVTDEDVGVTSGARLRGMAFLMCYRVCLGSVLELSDVLGRVLHLPRPLAVDLSHINVQRYVGGKWKVAAETVAEEDGAEEGENRVGIVAQALERAVLLGISDEMRVWYGGGAREQTDEK